jgi:hypothetical protein
MRRVASAAFLNSEAYPLTSNRYTACLADAQSRQRVTESHRVSGLARLANTHTHTHTQTASHHHAIDVHGCCCSKQAMRLPKPQSAGDEGCTPARGSELARCLLQRLRCRPGRGRKVKPGVVQEGLRGPKHEEKDLRVRSVCGAFKRACRYPTTCRPTPSGGAGAVGEGPRAPRQHACNRRRVSAARSTACSRRSFAPGQT